MADNVFGTPVTDEVTVMQRARKALNNPNAENKRDHALTYVRRENSISGNGVSTQCIFYNATGENLTYSQDDSRHGKNYDLYPVTVQNGQWGAFLHVGTTAPASDSVGFVVYRVMYETAHFCKQVLCWQTSRDQVNHAYCDIFDDGKVDTADDIYTKMEHRNRQTNVIKKGMSTTVTIEDGTSPLLEVKFTLANIE